MQGFFLRLILVPAQELGGDGVWEAQSLNDACCDCALCALFIDDDTDDFEVLRNIEELKNLLGVCHLRNCSRRDETYRIDGCEAGRDELLQIVGLLGRRNDGRQCLPRIPGTFHDFD